VDSLRVEAASNADEKRRLELGQFFTSKRIARQMAALFSEAQGDLRILDPGAGAGSLLAALVERLCVEKSKPRSIHVTAFELDSTLAPYLQRSLAACEEACKMSGIEFSSNTRYEDFIWSATTNLGGTMFSDYGEVYTHAILNPPYKKLAADSTARIKLNSIGVDVGNLYTAFLALTARMLVPDGQLVSITPRSFCNGPYFKSFRQDFLSRMALKAIHVFEERDQSFDKVLQENIIVHATKSSNRPKVVRISASSGPQDEMPTLRDVAYDAVVDPVDPSSFIRIVTDGLSEQIAKRMGRFSQTLNDLGLEVSTGRVVGFRAVEFLRAEPEPSTVPLLYPMNVGFNRIYPAKRNIKKSSHIVANAKSASLLVPSGTYVLVKRFSSKEEARRVVATVLEKSDFNADFVGIENHLNFFHAKGKEIPRNLAFGLTAFLNSSLFDAYFRQFSGHTQVNATDLRNVRYPHRASLEAIGRKMWDESPTQSEVDELVNQELFDDTDQANDPTRALRLVDEAKRLLALLGLPAPQQNERSALTLLALLGLTPKSTWADASNPTLGISQMLAYFREFFGKSYAPNTRETVRRYTVHQFVQAGLVVQNPDDPKRPINSPKNVYQVEPSVLKLARAFCTEGWEEAYKLHKSIAQSLRDAHQQRREFNRIPVSLSDGTVLTLSPGGQNDLIVEIVEEFCERFAPGGQVLYLGDAEAKLAFFDRERLSRLGVSIDEHGKMPDVVVYMQDRNWLILVEAVTSHGPISVHRMRELQDLFVNSTAGLVFVTAFLSRGDYARYLDDIAWETEVWIAEAPDHMIHHNGQRFLGPYATISPAPSID